MEDEDQRASHGEVNAKRTVNVHSNGVIVFCGYEGRKLLLQDYVLAS